MSFITKIVAKIEKEKDFVGHYFRQFFIKNHLSTVSVCLLGGVVIATKEIGTHLILLTSQVRTSA